MKYTLKHFLQKAREGEWTIGFIDNTLEEILEGKPIHLSWMKSNYKDGWFADPFILRVTDDEIVLLCEEFYYPINRGRISKLVIVRKTKKLKSVVPILQLDTHLSFPAIIRENGEIYVYPENYQGGGLNLYRYDEGKELLVKVRHYTDCLLTDAVITDLFDERLCFSTYEPVPNGSELSVFRVNDEEWQPVQTVPFDSKKARNAGDFFRVGGAVYRPAQDCNKTYGGGVILQRVEKTEDGRFDFCDVRRLFLTKGKFNRGCHTFNHYDGVTVIDVHAYRRPVLAKCINTIGKVKRFSKSIAK